MSTAAHARFTRPGSDEGVTVYRALNSYEEAKLPLRTGVTPFVREPYV